MSVRRRTAFAIVAAGLAFACAGLIAISASPFVSGAGWIALVTASIVLPFAVAAGLYLRFPRRVLPTLLVAIGITYFIRSLTAIDSGVTYGPARALALLSEVLLVWLMLAFPSGTLPRPWSRALIVWGGAVVMLLWLGAIATSRSIPTGGTFILCGASCPPNRLLIASAPATGEALATAVRALGAVLVFATAGILAVRLRHASKVMRQILAPVLLASIGWTVVIAAFLIVGSTPALRVLLAVAYFAVPIAIIVGLVRGRAYDAAALERLVRGLRTRPGPAQLREVMAGALDDPTLEIAYWLPELSSYASSDGLSLSLPDGRNGASVTRIAAADGQPVAALLHDPALSDHPQLLEAVTSTAALALESNRLETAVAAAAAGTITAVDAERRRIERDLHDGTQQRLIALKMKLSAAEQILGADADRARPVLDELRGDIDSALRDVRGVAHGIAPPVLVERGLAAALAEVADRSPMPVAVRAAQLPRFPPHVETAVYFCCLEALQNAAKHAGDGATVVIEVFADGSTVRFTVSDDGRGFDGRAARGRGLSNVAARMSELGGALEVASDSGAGTVLRGSLPA